MKGIILAGGKGTRLYPLTLTTSKQLLPVFDKPMIYYPLALLLMSQIKEILIISTPLDLPKFEALLGNGEDLGVEISYAKQDAPKGIAEAFIIAESFIGKDSVCLTLGDNIFYGHKLDELLKKHYNHTSGGCVFGYEVSDPTRYGVIDFDENLNVKRVIEKPKDPPSNYAVTGLYFYDHHVCEIAKSLTPSARGELEITDINQAYLEKGTLKVELLERGFAWLDTGTHDALQRASAYVQTIQERQGIQIACIEEIAYKNGWISLDKFCELAKRFEHSDYGKYLKSFIKKQKCLKNQESLLSFTF